MADDSTTADQPTYKHVRVRLSGQNGNAFNLMGIASLEARRKNVPDAEIRRIMDEAMAGDYDHLLRTLMKYFDVR